jgi:hypothetical protein
MGVELQLSEVGAYRSDFCPWGWMKSEAYKEKVNTRDRLVAHIMNSAAPIKQECQDNLRRATHTVAKRVEKCIEDDGGIFEHFELLQFIEIISDSCISTPIENWTHVYMNLFTRNSP